MSLIEKIVTDKILQRAEVGLNKYGVTMERKDLTEIEWLEHAQQEAMDLAVYLEKLIQEKRYAEQEARVDEAINGVSNTFIVINQ